jgi:hypothetical protein
MTNGETQTQVSLTLKAVSSWGIVVSICNPSTQEAEAGGSVAFRSLKTSQGGIARPPSQRKKERKSQLWWYIAAVPVPGRLRQEDHEFKAGLDYVASSSYVLRLY